jgi:hypothetical protein
MTIISIHQPVYLPWLGFFDKINHSDKFVFLDDVQYAKNGFQNRNKIRTSEGEMWLTVPTKAKSNTLLRDVKIDESINWIKKHTNSILLNYSRANYFEVNWGGIEKIFEKKYEYLIDVNIELIKFLMNELDIKTETIFSSELEISEKGSNRILNICKILKADEYISGINGKNYLNIDDFKQNHINVTFQNYEHPLYHQVFEPFIPKMGAIDLLFNEGDNAEKIIKMSNNLMDDK